MAKISIICTVKNGEKTIKDTIQSVINQTIYDWEFIIVDDGSSDKTLNILNEYSSKDDRIKIVETSGIGRGSALNLAVNESNSNYIVNIDADDLMHPKKLEIQYPIMKNNLNYFLLSTQSKLIYNDERITWDKIDKSDIKIEEVSNKNLMKNQVNHSSVMMRKDMLVEIGGYHEERKSQFDYELWLRAGHIGYELGVINRKLVAKRIHSNQSFEKKRTGQLLRSILLQMYYIAKSKRLFLMIFPLGRLFLGALPFKIRQKINSVLKV